MKVSDLPRIDPTEEEIRYFQHMSEGDGDGCPIELYENEKLKENKDHND